MIASWLLLALTCSAKAPHPCKQELIATYPNREWCLSGEAFLDYYPQPRQIKVWCQRATPTVLAQEIHHVPSSD